MCYCTQYDSPTCGHSWTSMSESCGYGADLLNCPSRQTMNYLIAPAYSCPQCNCSFADSETLEMIQGPWGCNQLVRNHYGGDFAVGNAWSGALPTPQLWNTSMVSHGYDTRVTGPYSGPALTHGPRPPMAMMSQSIIPSGAYHSQLYNDCYVGGRSSYETRYQDRKHQRKYDYQYKYRRSSSEGQGCSVM